MVSTKSAPKGVKFLSILYYIVAVVHIILALSSFIFGSLLGGIIISDPILAFLGITSVYIVGVYFLLFGVLEFFVARGLSKGYNWARIVTSIFALIWVVNGVVNLIDGKYGSIFWLIIHSIIIIYLWFSGGNKEFFSKTNI